MTHGCGYSIKFPYISFISDYGSDIESLSTSLEVTFHVLVDLNAWNWDENSTLSIRFGDPNIGGWEVNTEDLELIK